MSTFFLSHRFGTQIIALLFLWGIFSSDIAWSTGIESSLPLPNKSALAPQTQLQVRKISRREFFRRTAGIIASTIVVANPWAESAVQVKASGKERIKVIESPSVFWDPANLSRIENQRGKFVITHDDKGRTIKYHSEAAKLELINGFTLEGRFEVEINPHVHPALGIALQRVKLEGEGSRLAGYQGIEIKPLVGESVVILNNAALIRPISHFKNAMSSIADFEGTIRQNEQVINGPDQELPPERFRNNEIPEYVGFEYDHREYVTSRRPDGKIFKDSGPYVSERKIKAYKEFLRKKNQLFEKKIQGHRHELEMLKREIHDIVLPSKTEHYIIFSQVISGEIIDVIGKGRFNLRIKDNTFLFQEVQGISLSQEAVFKVLPFVNVRIDRFSDEEPDSIRFIKGEKTIDLPESGELAVSFERLTNVPDANGLISLTDTYLTLNIERKRGGDNSIEQKELEFWKVIFGESAVDVIQLGKLAGRVPSSVAPRDFSYDSFSIQPEAGGPYDQRLMDELRFFHRIDPTRTYFVRIEGGSAAGNYFITFVPNFKKNEMGIKVIKKTLDSKKKWSPYLSRRKISLEDFRYTILKKAIYKGLKYSRTFFISSEVATSSVIHPFGSHAQYLKELKKLGENNPVIAQLYTKAGFDRDQWENSPFTSLKKEVRTSGGAAFYSPDEGKMYYPVFKDKTAMLTFVYLRRDPSQIAELEQASLKGDIVYEVARSLIGERILRDLASHELIHFIQHHRLSEETLKDWAEHLRKTDPESLESIKETYTRGSSSYELKNVIDLSEGKGEDFPFALEVMAFKAQAIAFPDEEQPVNVTKEDIQWFKKHELLPNSFQWKETQFKEIDPQPKSRLRGQGNNKEIMIEEVAIIGVGISGQALLESSL